MRPWQLGCVALAIVVPARRAPAQGSLAEAAERARQAWLGHDAQGVVGQSASVLLQIPGADPSSPVNRAQAVELVRRHLRASVERSLVVRAIQKVDAGRGYAELERRYVVAGTNDERRETLFLGFAEKDGTWRLTELRSAP